MYSKDFREKVLSAVESGRTYRQVAKDFGISTRTIQDWKQRIEPIRGGNRRSKISIDALKKDVEKYPDAYQYEQKVLIAQNLQFGNV